MCVLYSLFNRLATLPVSLVFLFCFLDFVFDSVCPNVFMLACYNKEFFVFYCCKGDYAEIQNICNHFYFVYVYLNELLSHFSSFFSPPFLSLSCLLDSLSSCIVLTGRTGRKLIMFLVKSQEKKMAQHNLLNYCFVQFWSKLCYESINIWVPLDGTGVCI